MTLSNNELARRFAAGETSGKSNRMEIRERNDGSGDTYILGYGHAVYAYRHNGVSVLCNGWYGYSVTTSQHMNLIRRHVDHVSDERIRRRDLTKVRGIVERLALEA